MTEETDYTQKYPYYIMPDVEALNREKDPDKLRMHRRRIAANIGDQDALRSLLGVSSEDFYDFYGDTEVPVLSTNAAIDSFIEKFGKKDNLNQPGEEEEIPIAPPQIDYASILEDEYDEEDPNPARKADGTLDIIDTFLNRQPMPRIKPKKEPKEDEKPSLTESFAKIMIKNGNYRRALEIITEINLKNPEKSIYFADQIRFLKKVISLESQ